jgi:hypothetical protein
MSVDTRKGQGYADGMDYKHLRVERSEAWLNWC